MLLICGAYQESQYTWKANSSTSCYMCGLTQGKATKLLSSLWWGGWGGRCLSLIHSMSLCCSQISIARPSPHRLLSRVVGPTWTRLCAVLWVAASTDPPPISSCGVSLKGTLSSSLLFCSCKVSVLLNVHVRCSTFSTPWLGAKARMRVGGG